MGKEKWDIQVEDLGVPHIAHIKVAKDDLGSRKFEYTWEDKKISIPQEMHDMYEEVLNPGIPLRLRFKKFLKAESKLGRGFKQFKDFILMFAPKWARVGYNTVGEFILNEIIYPMQNEEKETSKSSTVITFGLLFLVGLLMQLGWIPADMVELSPDAQWVATLSGFFGVLLRLITDQPVKLGKSLRRLIGREQ